MVRRITQSAPFLPIGLPCPPRSGGHGERQVGASRQLPFGRPASRLDALFSASCSGSSPLDHLLGLGPFVDHPLEAYGRLVTCSSVFVQRALFEAGAAAPARAASRALRLTKLVSLLRLDPSTPERVDTAEIKLKNRHSPLHHRLFLLTQRCYRARAGQVMRMRET
jgi:hypothetical protein